MAGSLTAGGHPQEAAALIDKIRLTAKDSALCADQSKAAQGQIKTASAGAVSASKAADAVPEKGEDAALKAAWTQVKDDAKAAHEADLDNEQAATVLKTATDALDELAAQDSLTTRVTERSDSWTTLTKASGADLAKLGLVAISTAALILLLARLLLLAPARFGPVPLHPPRLISWAPLALLADAVVAIATAVYLPSVWSQTDWPADGAPGWGSALGLLLLALALLVALVLTWGWLFHRGRVAITMQDKGAASTLGAAAVVGHLRALGASPPRGLEIPLGGDAQTLNGSNISAPTLKGFMGGVLTFLQSALAVTPWRVLVDKDSDDQYVVMVSRHGRVQDSAVIRTDLLGRAAPKVQPLKLVAALALLSILDNPRSRRGLGGTRDWQSLGLQYDAVTGGRPLEERLQLLARAVDRDPTSWLARMSYRITLGSSSTDPDELRELSDWLRTAAGKQEKGDETLVVRMRFAAYTAHLNHRAVLKAQGRNCNCQNPEMFAAQLRAALNELPRNSVFAVQVRAAADALEKGASRNLPDIDDVGLTPETAYSYACFWADSPLPTGQTNALKLLQFAVVDSDIKASAATDPMLANLRRTNAYRQIFGEKPRAKLTEIAPFDFHKIALTAAGVTEAEALSRWELDGLATLLGYGRQVARALLDKADLITVVPEELRSHRLEIIEAVAPLGISTVRELNEACSKPGRRAQVADAILRACIDRNIADPDVEELNAWLRSPQHRARISSGIAPEMARQRTSS